MGYGRGINSAFGEGERTLCRIESLGLIENPATQIEYLNNLAKT